MSGAKRKQQRQHREDAVLLAPWLIYDSDDLPAGVKTDAPREVNEAWDRRGVGRNGRRRLKQRLDALERSKA